MWKQLGMVSVDSGTLMVGDPCYLTDDKWSKEDYQEYVVNADDYTSVPHEQGRDGKAVVFSSRFGDGVYIVEGKFEEVSEGDVRISEIRIKLIQGDLK